MPIVGDNLGRQTVSTKKADEVRKKVSKPVTVTKTITSKSKSTSVPAPVVQDFKKGITPIERKFVEKAPEPEPIITSGQQLRKQAINELSGSVKSYKEIDSSATYVYESGEHVSGKKLKHQMGTNIRDFLLGTTKIKPGMYVESGGQQYRVTGETRYLIEHAEPREKQELISSFGKTGYEELPKDFVGPVIPPSYTATQKAYGSLTKHEKEEYGFTYTPFIDQPIKEWKYHPGGKRYLEEHKSDVIDLYVKRHGVPTEAESYYMTENISSIRLGEYTKGYMSGVREQVWNIITKEKEVRKSEHFAKLPFAVRTSASMAHAGVSGALYPVTMTQIGVKYVTGVGDAGDVLGRIQTGKTVLLPDVAKELQKYHPGGPSGGLATVIGEGISQVTGGGRTSQMEEFLKDPWSGSMATVGEIAGMAFGGKMIHIGKVGTIRGLGHVRSGVSKYTGFSLPGYTKIMYHMPHRVLRRSWVKLGTKNIDDIMGTPYHSTKTLTPGGLSFAEGSTPVSRISWTIGKAKASQSLKYSADDFLLGSSSSSRVGGRFVIKSQTLHELPAFSTTPYGFAPTRFYRFTPSGLSYSSKLSLLPRFHTPTAFAIKLKNIFKAPSGSYEGTTFYSGISKWATQQPKGSWGVIGPKMYLGGVETEINIFGRTVLKRFLPSSKKLFHRFKGYQFHTTVPLEGGLKEVAPVVFTTPIHKGFPTGASSIINAAQNRIKNVFASSYTVGPSTSVISPSHILSKGVTHGISSSHNISINDKISSSFTRGNYWDIIVFPFSPSSHLYPSKSSSSSSFSSTSVSSIPSTPSYPSLLSYPSYPSTPSISSYLSKPSIPSTPSYPSLPSYPSYPSIPSSPSIPSTPSYPSVPLYPPKSYLPKKKKQVDPFSKYFSGYRFRSWKVPSMKEFFKGGI